MKTALDMTNFPLEAVSEIERLREENIRLFHEILYCKRLFFGRRSEKRIPKHPEGQLFIPFGEPTIAEETPDIKPIVEEIRIEAHKRRINKQENISRPKRQEIPAGIERRVRVIEPEGINHQEMVKTGKMFVKSFNTHPDSFMQTGLSVPFIKQEFSRRMLFPQIFFRRQPSKVSSRKAMLGIHSLHN